MTAFSNSNPPINRFVVHTPQHRCLSPSLTHGNEHTNHREINMSLLSFVLPRPKVNPCMVDSFICQRRVQPLRPANVCVRSWSSYIADGRNKSHKVSFSFFSPRLSLLALWEPWKRCTLLVQKAGHRYSQCLWFPASWPSGSMHERSSSVPLFSCIFIVRDSWCPLLGEQ